MGLNSKALESATFYGIVDTGYVAHSDIAEKTAALKNAGVKIIQLRAKKEDDKTRRELAYKILPLFETPDAPFFIINDDIPLAAEICKKIPNAGAHVGQDDQPPSEVRKILGKNAVIGLSTHSLQQATAADALRETLDYFAVGPVFATQTKPGRPAVGLELVKEVAKMKTHLPWFAIGGINAKTAPEVHIAGAKRIVAVSDVLLPADTTAAVATLLKAFNPANL